MKAKCFLLSILLYVGLAAQNFPQHPPTDYHFAIYPNFLWWDYSQPKDEQIAYYDWWKCDGLFQKTLSEQDLVNQMHFEPGLGVTFLFVPNGEQDVEFRFLGLLKWWGRRTISDSKEVTVPFKFCTVDWSLADKLHAVNTANFNSYDLNWWFHTPPRKTTYFAWGWSAGLRYINIDESLDATIYKSDRASFYNINAHNNVVGAQLGGEFLVQPYRFVGWGFTVRGGVGGDVLTTNTYLSDNNNGQILRKHSDSHVHPCWFAECNPFIALDIHARATFRVAYDVVYVQGIALASDQLYYGKKAIPLHDGGRLGVHGLQVGLNFSF